MKFMLMIYPLLVYSEENEIMRFDPGKLDLTRLSEHTFSTMLNDTKNNETGQVMTTLPEVNLKSVVLGRPVPGQVNTIDNLFNGNGFINDLMVFPGIPVSLNQFKQVPTTIESVNKEIEEKRQVTGLIIDLPVEKVNMFNKEFTIFRTSVATKRMWHDINNVVGTNGFFGDEKNFRDYFLAKEQVSREDYGSVKKIFIW